MTQRAFSLVELSIVLVILGLLTGGILAGQSLIRAAELRSVATEYSRYVAATQTFRDKYFAIPGDMNNAQSFWGVQNATPATCAVTPSTSAATCNGDGNGLIAYNASGSNEMFRFWQHLANAGLIEGSYNGVSLVANPAGFTTYLKFNSPASKVGNAGWSIFNYGPGVVGSSQVFDGNYVNSLFFGAVGNFTSAGALSPEEAWNIDTKTDDGKPTIGNVVAWKSAINPGCTTADTTGADWVYATTSKVCALIFRNPF